MKTQHTPGPWKAAGQYIEDQHGTIAKVMRPEDNALLIAAAPELLGALETIARELSGHPQFNQGNSKVHFCTHTARAAIRKSRGEQ